MIRRKAAAEFSAWFERARASLVAYVARGVTTDEAAVRAAITSPWSNGQTEGQITRLKLVRRQMYGRGNNHLQRAFTVDAPNTVWVTDITYIRIWQGWLYLAVVVDLYARKVVGWSMSASLSRELALDALLMAVWRRKPDRRVVVQSDQGSQYGSDDFRRFVRLIISSQA